jgi:signal transduction histidine kinase/ActR/RegA family two-component response regulator
MMALLGRLTPGIQARLVILVLVTVLPLVGSASFAMIRAVDDERARIQRDVRDRVESLLADVDRQISGIQAELRVLAVSPSLQTGDFAAFDRQMREALKIQGTSIVLHDTTAQQLLSTNRPFGEPLPRATNSEMHDRVVDTGKPQISDLIIGAVLRRPILTVGVPVFRDGQVAYVLAMGLGPEILSALLKEQNLPPDWSAGIFDRNGLIVAHNGGDRFIGQPAMPELRVRMSKTLKGWFPSVTRDQIQVYAAFRRSPISAWTVAIGVPREFVDGPLRRTRWIVFGGGAAALALSLALAGWIARTIRRPVEALMTGARALASGAPPGRPIGGVRELNQVADALHAAAMKLAQSRGQLEMMVEERTRELAATNARLRTEIDAREQAQTALAQAQKMEAVGQLTGGIAHDFNNLLTAVSSSLELLAARTSDERNLRLLHTAQRGAARGAKLTKSLLAFARNQHLEPVSADLNSIIAETTEMLIPSIGASVDIRHALASGLWPVLVDVNQIETALLNVAINARDAMPCGGTLLIETANIDACDSALPSEMTGCDCVLVSMRDTGTGMSPEVAERAFEPFFTTKEIGKGTGLGLSMVFGIVRQSGGTVRLTSRVWEGTTVEIYLPRAIEGVAPRSGRAKLARESEGARILVVDDDPDVRWITAEHLRGIGHDVTEAGSGRSALTILQRGDPCDVVVIDLAMPGLAGAETVRLARRARPDLKALFCTGYVDIFRFAAEIGRDTLLRKPFAPDALAEAVRRALRAASPSTSCRDTIGTSGRGAVGGTP